MKLVDCKRILVIEDEISISRILALNLREYGYEVMVAVDGESGLEQVSRNIPPDLIILDLMLPDLSGEEVCKRIREDDREEVNRIPIIMATAKSSDADRIIGKVIGASRYLTKPYSTEALLREIGQLLHGNGK